MGRGWTTNPKPKPEIISRSTTTVSFALDAFRASTHVKRRVHKPGLYLVGVSNCGVRDFPNQRFVSGHLALTGPAGFLTALDRPKIWLNVALLALTSVFALFWVFLLHCKKFVLGGGRSVTIRIHYWVLFCLLCGIVEAAASWVALTKKDASGYVGIGLGSAVIAAGACKHAALMVLLLYTAMGRGGILPDADDAIRDHDNGSTPDRLLYHAGVVSDVTPSPGGCTRTSSQLGSPAGVGDNMEEPTHSRSASATPELLPEDVDIEIVDLADSSYKTAQRERDVSSTPQSPIRDRSSRGTSPSTKFDEDTSYDYVVKSGACSCSYAVTK